MHLVVNEERFDALQMRVLEEIARSVRDGLREVGLKDDEVVTEATETISFSIAAIIDGSRIMELDGEEVVPVLTFAKEPDGDELICAESGGSWMHEYAFGVLEELFEQEEHEAEARDDDS